jgi:hypothetical protein
LTATAITFNIPRTIRFGAGASRKLPAQLRQIGARAMP